MDNEILALESYFGKTQTLQECEVVLDKIIKIIRENPKANIIGSDLNKRLESLLEKQFGFKKVCVNFAIDNPSYQLITGQYLNGPCTLPSCSAFFDMDCGIDNVMPDNKGYYDKKHAHVIEINMPIEFFFEADYTAGETLGIMLHEIGHNFETSPYRLFRDTIVIFSEFYFAVCIAKLYKYIRNASENKKEMINEFIKNMINEFKLITGKSEFVKKIANRFNILWDEFTSHIPLYKDIRIILAKATQYWYMIKGVLKIKDVFTMFFSFYNVTNPVKAVEFFNTIITRKGEKFADSFVATYGYNEEYASAMEKMSKFAAAPISNNEKLIKNCSILRDIVITRYTLLSAFSAPDHGSCIERAKYNINHLKKELNASNLRPEVRAQIELDIQKSEKMLADWLKKDDDEKLIINGYLQKFILNVFGDDSFLIEKMLPDYRA